MLGKRRIQYEEELTHDGRNYDVWFDYARLEEGALRMLREEGEGGIGGEEECQFRTSVLALAGIRIRTHNNEQRNDAYLDLLVIRQVIALCGIESTQHVEQSLDIDCLRKHRGFLRRLHSQLVRRRLRERFL